MSDDERHSKALEIALLSDPQQRAHQEAQRRDVPLTLPPILPPQTLHPPKLPHIRRNQRQPPAKRLPRDQTYTSQTPNPQPWERRLINPRIQSQQFISVHQRVRPDQKIRQYPPRFRMPLFSPSRRVTLKRHPRRTPHLSPQLPLHHNPRFLTEAVDKLLRPPRRAQKLRVDGSTDHHPAFFLHFI